MFVDDLTVSVVKANMHIRENEATDSIDWEYFYAQTEKKGRKWYEALWDLIMDEVRHIPCPTCREEGIALMQGLRDLIAYKVGKNQYDPKNFLEISELYTSAARHLKAEGTTPHMEHEIVA